VKKEVKLKKEVKHKAVKCNVRGCKIEASYWIDTAQLSGDFDMKSKHTFYLCTDDAEKLSNGGEFESYNYLNPETGRVRNIEIGVYSCDENCLQCND